MAKWSGNKVTPEQINNGNEYNVNDNVSIEELNGIVNNSFKAQEDAERALELATGANEANGTVVKINGEPQGTWDATISQKITEESLNELYGLLTINSKTQNNATYSLIDGTLSVSGTPSANTFEYLTDYISLKAGTYFFTFESAKNTGCRLVTGDGSSTVAIAEKNKPFTLTTDRNDIRVQMRLGSGSSFDGTTYKRFGILEGDWTGKILPNYGEYNAKMHISNSQADFLKSEHEKSLNELKVFQTSGTITQNGCTCTLNEDGTFTLNGTPAATAYFEILYNFQIGTVSQTSNKINLDENKTYNMSLHKISGSVGDASKCILSIGYLSNGVETLETVNLSNDNLNVSGYEGVGRAFIVCGMGVPFNNLVVGAMISEGTGIPSEFQQWNGYPLHPKDITPLTLWENATPTVVQNPETKTFTGMGTKKYCYFDVIKFGYNYIAKERIQVEYRENAYFNFSGYQDNALVQRSIRMLANGIQIFDGYRNDSVNNLAMIIVSVSISDY